VITAYNAIARYYCDADRVAIIFHSGSYSSLQEPQHVIDAPQTHTELALVRPLAALDVQIVLRIQKVSPAQGRVQGA
jgi:hypothetical protein